MATLLRLLKRSEDEDVDHAARRASNA
jgi:hypothetical protein